MPEAAANESRAQRRRSTRIIHSIPLTVRGIDLLSQPFEERTATLALNTFGCKYPSKHHLPKNTWVTLEIPSPGNANGPHRVRARVVWIQRPRLVRELFQIAVELETPGNIWSLESPPTDWEDATAADEAVTEKPRSETTLRMQAEQFPEEENKTEMERPLKEHMDENFEIGTNEGAAPVRAEAFGFAGTIVPEVAAEGSLDSPLIRELRGHIESHAAKAAEDALAQASETLKRTAETVEKEHIASAESFFRQWRDDLDRERDSAREEIAKRASEQMASVQDEISARVTGQMSWVREELRADLKQEFASHIDQMRALVADLERGAQAVREESQAATSSGDRLAQIKIALESAEAAVDQRMRRLKDTAQETLALDDLSKAWREKLEEQMGHARGEWNELLQSSLDGAAQQLASRLAENTQSALESAEGKLIERIAQLCQPVTNTVSEAHQALSGIRSALDAELQRARTSLVDIEGAAERVRAFSAQIDAASHDAVNQLHQRLDAALQLQVTELRRHADALTSDLPQRIQPALDAAGHQLVSKTLAEIDARLGPHLERVPDLVRELTAHEVQAEEGLRMYRERLRQAAESSRRDTEAQTSATLAALRSEFENARAEALSRWNEELVASGGRASHAVIEDLVRNAEWHQKQAQAYIETLTQESLAKTEGVFDARTQEISDRLGEQLAKQNAAHLEDAKRQLEGTSSEVIGRTSSQLEAAANAMASAFEEGVRQVAESAVQRFNESSDASLTERAQQIERAAEGMRMNFEHAAGNLLERHRTEMAAYGEQKFTEARDFHSRELAAAVEAARIERDDQVRDWYERLARANEESLQKYEDQLHGASELWVNVAVDKLNDSGQTALTALTRSGEQAFRNSLLKALEQVTESVRQSITDPAVSGGGSAPRPTLVNPSGQRENRAGM
ncbi:MAG TPA: hypothetical protein VIH76_01020 [Candidatus Acidoferrales bacterium]